MKSGFRIGFLLLMIKLLSPGQKGFCSNDYSMNKDCLKAYELILQLKLNEADDLLKTSGKTSPGNNIIPYLENYSDFLKIIISEEEDIYRTCISSRRSRLARLEDGNVHSPWHLYCQAQFNLQWAFARIKFGEYTTAAIELNRAYRQLTGNKELFPDFSPNDAALGVLHVLIGSVPTNYKWITETLSFEGTVDQGIGEFRQLFNNSSTLIQYPFLKSEGLFLLSFITFNFSASTDDSGFLLHLIENPDNKTLISGSPLLIYAASAFYLHNGMSGKALEILVNKPGGVGYYPFHYLEYLIGVAQLNKLDAGAKLHFLRFVVNFRGKNFVKSAYQRLAWIELLKNNPDGYSLYMDRVRLMGVNDVDSDKQAMAETKLSSPPDLPLLKARLLFDGGYYKEALSVLDKASASAKWSKREKLEYTYRLGRIYHKSGNHPKAILNYAETLKQGSLYPYYYAANAALQLGIIYENTGNRQKARYYYEQCLNLKYEEYQTSISQKAKAGLSRVK